MYLDLAWLKLNSVTIFTNVDFKSSLKTYTHDISITYYCQTTCRLSSIQISKQRFIYINYLLHTYGARPSWTDHIAYEKLFRKYFTELLN